MQSSAAISWCSIPRSRRSHTAIARQPSGLNPSRSASWGTLARNRSSDDPRWSPVIAFPAGLTIHGPVSEQDQESISVISAAVSGKKRGSADVFRRLFECELVGPLRPGAGVLLVCDFDSPHLDRRVPVDVSPR